VSTLQLQRALGAAILCSLSLLWAGPARAEGRLAESSPLSRQVVEADVLIGFGQHLGQAPMVSPGASLELRVARFLGIALGGHATVAVPASAGFIDRTAVGGGFDAAARLYVRAGWPRGFGVGAAIGLSIIPGVAIATPRLELFYRFVLFGHLALRLHGFVGGVILWDTAPTDGTAGPAPAGPEAVDPSAFDTYSQRGWAIGLGVSVGWACESPPRWRRHRR
jgi:hypothetical protein